MPSAPRTYSRSRSPRADKLPGAIPGCEDRRQVGRVTSSVPFQYRGTDTEGFDHSFSLSMSPTGARLIVNDSVQVGQSLQLSFAMTRQWKFDVTARVVWHEPFGPGREVVGVNFPPLESREKARLQRWLRRKARNLRLPLHS